MLVRDKRPQPKPTAIMGDLSGRKVFKVFNQDFVVDDRYTVTKELGQGAYGIVWYDLDCVGLSETVADLAEAPLLMLRLARA